MTKPEHDTLMSSDTPRMARPADRRSSTFSGAVVGLLLLAVVAVLTTPGCSCRSETPQERAARLAREEAERIAEEERLREEELAMRPVVVPPAKMLPAGSGPVSQYVKPGHWNAVLQPAKANAEDFDGAITYEVVDKSGAPVTSVGTPLRLTSRRPLVVARESEKSVDALFYCPPAEKPRLRSSVSERRSGRPVPTSPLELKPLADHQYHFVVLAKEPGRYTFLDSLASVTARLEARIATHPVDGDDGALAAEKNYRVVAVPADAAPGEAALPDNPLAWTSIAYLLWDEVDPELLRPTQRDALVDWLNWGGQLIVNGPDSLDLLRGSFLEPLLPAASAGTRTLTAGELSAMESAWGVGGRGKPLQKSGEWSGVKLEPKTGVQSAPGLARLLVERRVGRGRVVISAMQLADRRLLAWSAGYDNLFNAAVLRRPPREFVTPDDYADSTGIPFAVRWADRERALRIDPLINTRWRGFVRDTVDDPDALALRFDEDPESQWPGGLPPGAGAPTAAQGATLSTNGGGGFQTLRPPRVPGGAGAVRDFSPVADAAREALVRSAGVSVPGAGFVIGCVLAYLVVLVPLNWALFAALGRVEYAWAAAPVIALFAAWGVVHQARLDIGFVRARTEVAVLEIQPDTPRGLLTRFTALYTSLSTSYEAEFDAPAVAAPFPRDDRDDDRFGPPGTVAYERLEKARLRDLYVASASTEFLRSEEMFDVSAAGVEGSSVPGGLRVEESPNGAPRLVNRTAWQLEDVVIVERPDGLKGEPRLEGCWVGDLEPGGATTISFFPVDDDGENAPFAQERADADRIRRGDPTERLDLSKLTRLALDPARFEPGERRVVGLARIVTPGVEYQPASSQKKGAMLVVATLGYGVLPPPASDVNGPMDVALSPSTASD